MKKALSLVLALVLALGLTIPAFAADNKTEITATVADMSYDLVIPATTQLTETAHTEVPLGTDGKVTIKNVTHPSEDWEVSYTVDLTLGTLTNDDDATIKTTYGYKQGTATNYTALTSDTEVKVFTGGKVVDSYVAVSADDTQWKAAASGTYTAVVTFNFEKAASGAVLSFKAVAVKNETATTQYATYYDLTFYYDKKNHNPDNSADIKVYDNLPTNASSLTSWGYNTDRAQFVSVTIDPSVSKFKGLTSTNAMFMNMSKANSIAGAEYLDVSNVTDMTGMFASFGTSSKTITTVPNVSNWNTSKVEKIASIFQSYAAASTSFNAVPDVSGWDVGKVSDCSAMFFKYGTEASALNFTLDLSGWTNGENSWHYNGNEFAQIAKDGTLANWSVTIPAYSYTNANTSERWYSCDADYYIEPLAGYEFTVKGE